MKIRFHASFLFNTVTMGIFRYFYWHFKTYKDSITYMNKNQSAEGFDILGLDLNAIFHPVCAEYFFDKRMSVKTVKTNKGAFQAICDEIEAIINMVPPREELILSIDGVAGLSKMNQQRQRRFRSAKDKTDDERAIFDSNQISTGTAFLSDLSAYITRHFTAKKRPYRVIVQDESVMGEGEHKIIRYLERLDKKRVCIYSPDADLIMLGIGLHKKTYSFCVRIFTTMSHARTLWCRWIPFKNKSSIWWIQSMFSRNEKNKLSTILCSCCTFWEMTFYLIRPPLKSSTKVSISCWKFTRVSFDKGSFWSKPRHDSPSTPLDFNKSCAR